MSQTLGNADALPAPNAHATGSCGAPSREQQRVCNILQDLASEIARMYEACVLVLDHVEHDEKLPLAAHAVREIFRHLPVVCGVKLDRPSLMKELQNLKSKYKKWHPSFLEGGEMPDVNPHQDANLRDFLMCYEHFAQYDGGLRREQAASVFGRLIPGASHALLQDFAKMYLELHDYFEKVAHHGFVTSKEEFTAHLKEFHNCLLATRRPDAVTDLDAIDQLIQEATPHGHP